MTDLNNINKEISLKKEPPWKQEEYIINYLERTITLNCPYANKQQPCSIRDRTFFYWCGSPLDKEFFPDENPIKVKDESIKKMLCIPFDSLTYYCFGNFWKCPDHPGY